MDIIDLYKHEDPIGYFNAMLQCNKYLVYTKKQLVHCDRILKVKNKIFKWSAVPKFTVYGVKYDG